MPFRVVFGDFVGLRVPRSFSSSLITSCVLNAEDLQCLQPSKMKEFEVDFEGKWDAVAKRWMQ